MGIAIGWLSWAPAIAFGPSGEIHLVYGAYGEGVEYAYFDGCNAGRG